jgi:hypothetical protein
LQGGKGKQKPQQHQKHNKGATGQGDQPQENRCGNAFANGQ